jgi:DNA mismatch endonuclease (patch repair protein)
MSFRVNDPDVLGKPDIVFRQARVCVFLDSDFWHGWQYPRWKHLLRTEFWRTKIQRNRERDEKVTRKLRRKGWTVLRFWEHNLRDNIESAVASVASTLLSKNGIPRKGGRLTSMRSL